MSLTPGTAPANPDNGGNLARAADVSLVVDAQSTQRIQETHITIGHILCEQIEDALFGEFTKKTMDSI